MSVSYAYEWGESEIVESLLFLFFRQKTPPPRVGAPAIWAQKSVTKSFFDDFRNFRFEFERESIDQA